MAKVKIQGHASGTGILTVTAPNTSTDRTITLPDATGTLLNSDGDGSSLTALSATNLGSGTVPTARLGTGTADSSVHLRGDGTWAEAGGGGITDASQWRVTTSFTGEASPIASNLEVVDTYGYGSLGSAMTESSGVFTFPSTGYWLIEFTGEFYLDGYSRYNQAIIETTTDDSSYNVAALSTCGIAPIGEAKHGHAKASFLFDVTSTSTHKVRFSIALSDTDTTIFSSTSTNQTHMTFIRLGDT